MPLISKIKTPEQHHSRCSGVFIGDLTYFTQGFHVYVAYFTYWCFIVDVKQVNPGWKGFQTSK